MTTTEPNAALEPHQAKRVALVEQSKLIDQAAAGAIDLFHGAEISTEKELALACAVVDLRKLMTKEWMEPVMSLMNTDLGFRTDKDPNRPASDGKEVVPYGFEVVRDVVIQAKMLGFRIVGNEVNIIAGRFYPTKNGYRRKLTDKKSFPGLTDFRDSYEAPQVVEGKTGVIVKCQASWIRNGVPDSLTAEFSVKVNAGMAADAIVGKAERKLCKRVHDILLGMSTPDADEVGDNRTIDAETTPVNRPVFGEAKDAKPKEESKPFDRVSAVSELKAMVEGMSGTIDQLKVICAKLPGADQWNTWADITEEQAQTMLRGRGKIVAGLTK